MHKKNHRRSLWYIAHGFTSHADSLRETIGTGQCLLKYNNKGGQSESVISPIKLKQLFVPFLILICGFLLAFFQFLRELMHARFERQLSIPAVTNEVLFEHTDPDTTSHSEPIVTDADSKSKPQHNNNANVVTSTTTAFIEFPLPVVDSLIQIQAVNPIK